MIEEGQHIIQPSPSQPSSESHTLTPVADDANPVDNNTSTYESEYESEDQHSDSHPCL